MIRIAAVGDLHLGLESAGRYRPGLAHLGENADVFLLAGDLTRCGSPAEAELVAAELSDLPVPVVAVLGNHDLHADAEGQVSKILEDRGIQVLEGGSTTIECNGNGAVLGIAGVKGFGGGFLGRCATDFGEPEMKAFIRHTKAIADSLEHSLADLEADVKVALLHYSPVAETLQGEPPEIYPFLGSYLLAEAIDRAGADLVIHGHAHRGTERGMTAGGVRVRNVAQPVIQHSYRTYIVHGDEDPDRVRVGSANVE